MSIIWIGHAGFVLKLPRAGTDDDDAKETTTTVYIDTWIGNPKSPDEFKTIASAVAAHKPDLMLVTHGHFDHAASAPDICKASGAKMVAIHEVSEWAKTQGVPSEQAIGMNKGGTIEMNGLRITMVNADHSSGCPGGDDGSGGCSVGGASAGFVIQAANNLNIYHAGDTNVFLDMQVISELYTPQLALLPIGGWYTMAEREAAYAIDRLLASVKTVVPMHFGTFPILKGNTATLKTLVTRDDVNINELEIGIVYNIADIL